jgi:hypothetical protein
MLAGPFKETGVGGGHLAVVFHYDRDVTKPLSMCYPSWKNISKTFEISASIVRMIIRRLGLQQQHIGRRINS